MLNKNIVKILSIFILLLITIFVSIFFGGSKLKFSEIMLNLFHPGSSSIASTIIWDVRLPRILLGIIVGMGLAISGCVFQGLLRNPLADPYTLGISGGAAFGVSIAMITGISSLSLLFMPLSAFLGTLLCITIVYFLTTRKDFSLSMLILSGVILGFIFSSLVLLIFALSDAQKIHSIILWIMGDLSSVNINLLKIIYFTVILSAFAIIFFARELNILILGEEKAYYMGIETQNIKKILFLLASLITGACVSVSGVIGFVGLIIPHIMRYIVGYDNQILLPASALGGAIFLCLCDALARTIISPVELPVGVITGLIGGIFFLILILKSSRERVF